jgi:hypothetical protein
VAWHGEIVNMGQGDVMWDMRLVSYIWTIVAEICISVLPSRESSLRTISSGTACPVNLTTRITCC